MNAATRFCLYVPDDEQPVDGTDDYDEAVALCRMLVEEDGHPHAEVRCGDRICCAAVRDGDGRTRVTDVGEAGSARRIAAAEESVRGHGAAPGSLPGSRGTSRAPTDVDVTSTPGSAGLAGACRGLETAAATTGPAEPTAAERPIPPIGAAGTGRAGTTTPLAILGEEHTHVPTVWLGL